MGVDVSMVGIGELRDSLEAMVENAKEIEEEALYDAAVPIWNDAKNTVAYVDRSGRLRKFTKISKVVKKRAGYRVIRVYCAERHAPLVEYGHSGNDADPHPFLGPAFERHKNESAEILGNKLREALK